MRGRGPRERSRAVKLLVGLKVAQALNSPASRRAVLSAGLIGLIGVLGTGTMVTQAVAAALPTPATPGAPTGAGCLPGSCVVSASEKEAAQQLAAAMAAGRLVFLNGAGDAYGQQILGMADGTGTCHIQLPALQLIQIALNMFDSVGISDLNRACTGDLPGSSGYSAHWVGRAIDFYFLQRCRPHRGRHLQRAVRQRGRRDSPGRVADRADQRPDREWHLLRHPRRLAD